MIDLNTYFTSLVSASTAVVLIAGWINTHITKFDGIKAQILSWVISIALAFLGTYAQVGMFENATLLSTILNGLGIGLIANGIFTIDFVQALLILIKAKTPPDSK